MEGKEKERIEGIFRGRVDLLMIMQVSETVRCRIAFVGNILLCNVGWFANVSSAAAGKPMQGPLIELFIIAMHLSVIAPLYGLDRLNECLVIIGTVWMWMKWRGGWGRVPDCFLFGLQPSLHSGSA